MMVNLKTFAEKFAEVARERYWCGEAEDNFAAATGVMMLEPEEREMPCGCGSCSGSYVQQIAETRFRLPADAPEEVEEARIVRALCNRARYERSNASCCESCTEKAKLMIKALEEIASVLPSKPDLFA